MNVSKSIIVDAPAKKIHHLLNDFSHWKSWSPWLIMEPNATVDIAEDKRYYEWKGARVGTGNMRVLDEKEGEFINYDLNFLTPWKSSSKVRFDFKPKGETTEVTWHMFGSLPWFMFWMKKMMIAFVGMDYQRGLAMLKDYVEDGEAHSKLDFIGEDQFAGCRYVGIKTNCSIDSVGVAMQKDFETLDQFFKDHHDLISGPAFSIYHKWDMVKNQVVYTSAFPVKEIPENLQSDLIKGDIPQTRVYKLRHIGPYLHLGNAWSTLYNMARSKEFKQNKKIDPFEIYVNDPMETTPNELITDVCFPVK